jgi:RNA polymerase sigma-70 factor (ECF subfamily)
MQAENLNQHLSQITTLWSLVCRAHGDSSAQANDARQRLFERYGGAVRRYLGKILPDQGAADEVFQEFAVQVFHGRLRGADPGRGRFRNFVKGTLFHLVADYHNQERRRFRALPADGAFLVAPEENSDQLFEQGWCDELLARAWARLAEEDGANGQSFYTVLRLRADQPALRSTELAQELAAQLGRPFTAAGVRQTLHRARQKFAALLLDEVAHSLNEPTAAELEDELAELGLLEYCRPALNEQAPESQN